MFTSEASMEPGLFSFLVEARYTCWVSRPSQIQLDVVVELASIQQPRGSNLYISMRISMHPLFAPVNQNRFLVHADIRKESKSLSL